MKKIAIILPFLLVLLINSVLATINETYYTSPSKHISSTGTYQYSKCYNTANKNCTKHVDIVQNTEDFCSTYACSAYEYFNMSFDVQVERIHVHHYRDGNTENICVTIASTSDGITWNNAASEYCSSSGSDFIFNITKTISKYWRIYGRATASNQGVHEFNIDFWGEDIFNPIISVANTFSNCSINFTSDGSQSCGYNTSGNYALCGPTQDGTPTIRFNTSGSASCKLWNEAKNWTTLNNQGVSDCTTTGGSSHVCTLSDALSNGTQTLYISCKSGNDEINDFSYYPSNKFNISILAPVSSSQSIANEAIELGITKSSIWPGALIYTFQPVYIRTKNNSQAYAVFDKVALYGNQRWAFNYRINGEASVNSNGQFYNISPVFYFWEGVNLSYYAVSSQVTSIINTTKI
jgi:hypothetical protein